RSRTRRSTATRSCAEPRSELADHLPWLWLSADHPGTRRRARPQSRAFELLQPGVPRQVGLWVLALPHAIRRVRPDPNRARGQAGRANLGDAPRVVGRWERDRQDERSDDRIERWLLDRSASERCDGLPAPSLAAHLRRVADRTALGAELRARAGDRRVHGLRAGRDWALLEQVGAAD